VQQQQQQGRAARGRGPLHPAAPTDVGGGAADGFAGQDEHGGAQVRGAGCAGACRLWIVLKGEGEVVMRADYTVLRVRVRWSCALITLCLG